MEKHTNQFAPCPSGNSYDFVCGDCGEGRIAPNKVDAQRCPICRSWNSRTAHVPQRALSRPTPAATK